MKSSDPLLQPNTLSILETYQSEMQNIQTHLQMPMSEVLSKTPHGPFFQYIPKMLREYIEQHPWKCREKKVFTTTATTTPLQQPVILTLYICCDHNPTPEIRDFLTAFSFMVQHASMVGGHSKPYELYYYATPHKKQFPYKIGELIDEIHVNSGYTVKGPDDPIVPIYIFRREECRRVLFHELFHAFGMDSDIAASKNGEITLCPELLRPIQAQHLCDGSDGVRIYEAFTETQATVLNTLLPHRHIPIVRALTLERQHVHRLIELIRHHYGISTSSDYRKYKQGVSKTISYFLLRGFLMDQMDRFIQNNLLQPSSTDYVNILREGLQGLSSGQQGQHRAPSRRRRRRQRRNHRHQTLKMNHLS